MRVIADFYVKQGKGVFPFKFGRDYTPDMSDENTQVINQANKIGLAMQHKIVGTESIW